MKEARDGKKLEAREPTRARGGSAQLGVASELSRASFSSSLSTESSRASSFEGKQMVAVVLALETKTVANIIY